MTAQKFMYGLLLYFVTLGVLVGIMGGFGLLNQEEVIVGFGNEDVFNSDSLNQTHSEASVGSVWGGFSLKTWFKNIFSFMFWNISIHIDNPVLMQFFWVFKAFFVWLPLVMLGLAFYYSLPTVGS